MKCLAWAVLITAPILLGSCGGDDKKPPAPEEDAGADVIVPSGDRTPPAFAGAQGVEIIDDRKVRVFWDPASDDATPENQIAYRVYRSTSSGGFDFSRARRCGSDAPVPDGGDRATAPCYTLSASGADGAIFTDVTPGVEFFFVARAVDASGNEDDNDSEVGAVTEDGTPPEFGGASRVEITSARSIRVHWGEGYDKPVPASLLKYEVFLKADERPNPASDTPAVVTEPAETSADIEGLDPLTNYWVHVRVIDPAGNVDDNPRFLSVRTPEGIAPSFDGAKRAAAFGTSVRIFWTPATDNVTEVQNIEYDVWQELAARNQNLDGPPQYTSQPGAASILIEGLEQGTNYFFVVRARDVAGNRDMNTREVRTRTPVVTDNVDPTFTGGTTVVGTSTSTLQVTWDPANDDNPLARIEYDVYVSSTPNNSPANPTYTTAMRQLTITGLAPNTRRYVVVRARDEAGNFTAAAEASGTTLAAPPCDGDSTAPTWGGGLQVARVDNFPSRLDISWNAATDTGAPAGDGGSCGGTPADVRYHVCVDETQANCVGAAFNNHVRVTTAFGATTALVDGLLSRTDYFVAVRAEDRAGNLETGDRTAIGRTATSWSLDVRPLLFVNCISCHSGEDRGDPDGRDVVAFDDPLQIVDVGGSYVDDAACVGLPPPGEDGCVLKLIDEGRPQFSLIYRKINAFNLRTPPFSDAVPNLYTGLQEPRDTGAGFTPDEDLALREWIEQGAVAN